MNYFYFSLKGPDSSEELPASGLISEVLIVVLNCLCLIDPFTLDLSPFYL